MASDIGSLRILTINDVYAFGPVQGLGGYAEVSTLIEKYRTENTLVIINGDFLGGSSLAEHFKGKCVVDVLDAMGIQYAVIGNHEFDFGNDQLQKLITESSFPWLGSNIKEKDSGSLFKGVTDTAIEKFTYNMKDGSEIELKVGLFGLCTLDTPVLSWPGKDIIFEPVVECALQKSNELKEKCDFMIAVTHVDLKDDHSIADRLPKLQLILGGHEHYPYNCITNSGTLIFKSGQNAYWLGVIDFAIEVTPSKEGAPVFKFFPSWQMIVNRNILPNPKIVKVIKRYQEVKEEADSLINKEEIICTVRKTDLITKTSAVRSGPAQIMNIVADAIWKEHTVEGKRADFAIINGGIVRGDSVYPPDTDITLGILMHEVPFPLQLVMVRIAGKFIRQALEQHIAKVPAPVGSYPHVSRGVSFSFDTTKPPMERIQRLVIDGNVLEEEKEYTITITKFLSIGGDGCSGYTHGTVLGSAVPLFDTLLRYLKAKKEIEPFLEERVVRDG